MLPKLSANNLFYTRLPHVLATFVASPPVSSVFAPYSGKFAKNSDHRAIRRNLDRAQSDAYLHGTVIPLVLWKFTLPL